MTAYRDQHTVLRQVAQLLAAASDGLDRVRRRLLGQLDVLPRSASADANEERTLMTLSDVPEMIAAWRAGELLLDDVYHLCLNLFATHRVEVVLALLPIELRGQFEASLVNEFGNDVPAEQYFFLESGTGDNPNKVPIINEVRAYLARVSQRKPSAGDHEAPGQLRGSIAITYSIGSEFAPDDPFGREEVELTAAGALKYSRRSHGTLNAIVGTFSPARFYDLLGCLERTSFPTPPQRGFQPGPGPATIAVAPSGASISIDTMFAEGIDGYREFVATLEDLLTRLRKDDPSLADDWGVAATIPPR